MNDIQIIPVDRKRIIDLMRETDIHTTNTQSVFIIVEFPRYECMYYEYPDYQYLLDETNTPRPITLKTKIIESVSLLREFSITSPLLMIPFDSYEIESIYIGLSQFLKEIIEIDYPEKSGIDLPEYIMRDVRWGIGSKLSITINDCKYVCDNYFTPCRNGGYRYDIRETETNSTCINERGVTRRLKEYIREHLL